MWRKDGQIADDRVMADGMLGRILPRAEDAPLGRFGEDLTAVVLAPLVPLGSHSALGPVSQDTVITAVRLAVVQRFGAGLRFAGGSGPSWRRDRFRAAGRTRFLRRPVLQDQRVRRRRGAGDWGRRLY